MTSSPGEFRISIRSFQPGDLAACRRLYVNGLLGGKIAENDTGFDIDNIETAYMKPGGNHFWVAVLPEAEAASPQGEVVGMVGVQHYDEDIGEIRRLRVAAPYRRRGIGGALIETALRFCQEQGYLKIKLDTFMEREVAMKLFEKFRFRPARTRTVSGKEMTYFYLDLYTGQDRPRTQDSY